VFCRNVLIYFDQEAKRRTLEKIAAVMAPDGYLLLGAAETVLGVTDAFHHTAENRGLYQRNASWQKAA
jgi:chemotaxis protein methyltransferase CheR